MIIISDKTFNFAHLRCTNNKDKNRRVDFNNKVRSKHFKKDYGIYCIDCGDDIDFGDNNGTKSLVAAHIYYENSDSVFLATCCRQCNSLAPKSGPPVFKTIQDPKSEDYKAYQIKLENDIHKYNGTNQKLDQITKLLDQISLNESKENSKQVRSIKKQILKLYKE